MNIKSQAPRKVAFIAQAPTPYLTPILNALGRLVHLEVLFFRGLRAGSRKSDAWSEFDDPWGEPPQFRYQFARSLLIHEPRSDFHVQLAAGSAWRGLSRQDPDAVMVHGWGPLVLEPLAWAAVHRRARVIWTESHTTSGLVRSRMSDRVRGLILRRADAIVSNGSRATAYAVALGVDPTRVVTSCLPSPLFERAPAQLSLRGDRVRFLFVGRLVALKRARLALEAFEALAQMRPEVELVIVGTGPEEAALRAQARVYGKRITFAGRLEQAALRRAYLDADVLLMPSVREVWGLVVNEALAAGMFVVATSGVGSATDLLDPESGEIVRNDNRQAWFDAVSRAANVDRSELARTRRRQRVADCTPEAFADDFKCAVDAAIDHASRHRG